MPKTTGLLFDSHLIKAMLDGTKTMTRRLQGLEAVNAEPGKWEVWDYDCNMRNLFVRFYSPSNKTDTRTVKCPWNVGSQFYVKEAWRVVSWESDLEPIEVQYKDGTIRRIKVFDKNADWAERVANQSSEECIAAGLETDVNGWFNNDGQLPPTRWRSPLFMPRCIARPELMRTITGIGCERVQEISEEDCIAEGVVSGSTWSINPQHSFRYAWNSICATPKPVHANSKWAKVTGWSGNSIIGYISLPYAAEDGDHRELIQGKPHKRCVNPFVWRLEFGGID